jgi:hypothetical protein
VCLEWRRNPQTLALHGEEIISWWGG